MNRTASAVNHQQLQEIIAALEEAIQNYINPKGFFKKLFFTQSKRNSHQAYVQSMGVLRVINTLTQIAEIGLSDDLYNEWYNTDITYSRSIKDNTLVTLSFNVAVSLAVCNTGDQRSLGKSRVC